MFFQKDKKNGSSRILTEAEIKRKLYGEYETTSEAVHASHEVKMTGSSFATGTREESRTAVKMSALPRNEDAAVRSSAVASAGHPFRKAAPESKPGLSGFDWKANALQAGRSAGNFLVSVLWKVGGLLVKALDFFLRLLDPRKPQARRLLYSITACILVAALFWGVFRLNAQRKLAMSGELKTAPVTAAAPVPAADEPAAVSEPESSEPADSQRDESQEMILKALENSESAATASSEAPAPEVITAAVSSGKFVIQVATYAVLQDANRIIQSMKDAGFSAFYKKQIRNSTGHSFYPVYLGRFENYAAAQQELAKFRKSAVARPFQDAFVRTLEL